MAFQSFFKSDPIQNRLKFVTLTEDDLAVHRTLKELSNGDSSRLNQVIQDSTLGSLVKLAVHDKWVQSQCLAEPLKGHWDKKITCYGTNIRKQDGHLRDETLAAHYYQPQSTIASFHLLMGLFYFWRYEAASKEQSVDSKDAAQAYLSLSTEYGCGFALLKSGEIYLERLNDDAATLDDIVELQKISLRFAGLYFSAGFYHLAIVYQKIALKIESIEKSSEIPILDKAGYFKEAYIALCVAQELYIHSEAMINNVYGSIAVPSIDELSLDFNDNAQLTLEERNIASRTAKKIAEELISLNKLPHSVDEKSQNNTTQSR